MVKKINTFETKRVIKKGKIVTENGAKIHIRGVSDGGVDFGLNEYGACWSIAALDARELAEFFATIADILEENAND